MLSLQYALLHCLRVQAGGTQQSGIQGTSRENHFLEGGINAIWVENIPAPGLNAELRCASH
jgi:hypothetical protein